MIYSLDDKPYPQIAKSSYIAASADIIGWVKICDLASIWFNVVLRGDNEIIEIGKHSNVQDCSVFHTDLGCPLIIEDNVTVGHSTMLHGCRVKSGCLVGIGSIIMNHAVIGEYSLVGVRSLITENKVFPDRSLIIGSPAKRVRELTDQEVEEIQGVTESYVNKIPRYRKLERIS